MKINKLILMPAIFLVMLATSCGGADIGGTSSGNPIVETGLASFADRDIEEAEETFCDGSADDPTDSELAFGCFFAKLLLLSEGTDADALLASFDEPAFDIGALFDSGGLFDNSELITIGSDNFWPQFNYDDFGLPLADTFAGAAGFSDLVGSLLQTAIDNGVSAEELQGQATAFIDDFEEFEDLLDVVLDDTGFTLALPAELFYTAGDVDVSYNDARLMMAATQQSLVGFNIIDAYDLGVNIDDVVTSGVVDQEILVADLNGSGETVNGVTVDTTPFLTLVDSSLITAQQSRFEESLSRARTGLQAFVDGETSEFFTTAFDRFNLSRAVDALDEFIDATSGLTTMDSLGIDSVALSLDLEEFFTNPPDSADLGAGSGDPFVFEDGKAKPVESYFRDLLDGIAEF